MWTRFYWSVGRTLTPNPKLPQSKQLNLLTTKISSQTPKLAQKFVIEAQLSESAARIVSNFDMKLILRVRITSLFVRKRVEKCCTSRLGGRVGAFVRWFRF